MTRDRFERVLLKKAREAVKSKVAEYLADRWSYSPTGYEEEDSSNGGSVRQNYVTDFYSLIGSGYATDREERDFEEYRRQWETDFWPEYANENGLDPKDTESAEAREHFDRWMDDFDPIESCIEIEWEIDGWDEEKMYWIKGNILDCCTIEISSPEDGVEECIDRFFNEFDLRLRSESRRDEKMTYDLDESRRPRGRMIRESRFITRRPDSELTQEQTEQAYEAFKGYVEQIVQAAEHGLPGEEWEINVGESGNPFCRSVWAVKNFDERYRTYDDFVSLFQIVLDEEYKDGHYRFEDGYFRLTNRLEDPNDHGYLATVSNNKIWFTDFFEDRGREPGFFASASELDRVEHIVKVSLRNR